MSRARHEITVVCRRESLARTDEALRWTVHWNWKRVVLAVFRYELRIENTGTERVLGDLVVPFSDPPERINGYITIAANGPEVMECRQTGGKEGGPKLTLTPKVPDGSFLGCHSLATGQLDLHPGESVSVEILTAYPAPDAHPLVPPIGIPRFESIPLPKVRLRGVAIVDAPDLAAIDNGPRMSTAGRLKSWGITTSLMAFGFLLAHLPLATLLARPDSRTTLWVAANAAAMVVLAVGGSAVATGLFENGLRAWGRVWFRATLAFMLLAAVFLAWQGYRTPDPPPASQVGGRP
jgi:hypothetical protein